MKTLLIIESPGKKDKLQSILGPDYIIKASFGHIRDLPKHELGVKTPSYAPHYVVEDDRNRATIAGLRKAAGEVDRVLLGMDPDREGEAIAWHVADVLGLEDPQRVTYQSVTKPAILAAVAAPRPLNLALVHAQEARRVLDRLVGYEVSPALSDQTGESLSAGRVQSPAVRLVVDRERAITAFTTTTHYGAEIRFGEPVAWRATFKPDLPEKTLLLDRAVATAAAGVRSVSVASFADTERRRSPPPPFTTSTLQQRAQAALKFRPKRTMELAQNLYEQGAITYMRTDSPNLSAEAFTQVAEYAQSVGLPVVAERRTWRAKGGAQEAHEAIRPNHFEVTDSGTSADEKALYALIWSRSVASQLIDAVYAVRTAELSSPDGVSFVARGRVLTDRGWLQLTDIEDDDAGDDATEEMSNAIPVLTVGTPLAVAGGSVVQKVTKAPPRFTAATLIKELESNGIGRPATYAAILENIQRRSYINEDKKSFLSPTESGVLLIDQLTPHFSFVRLDYTAALEMDLDAIADGTRPYIVVVADAHKQLRSELHSLGAPSTPSCPACESSMRRRRGSKGPFWSCSQYPACKSTRPIASTKTASPDPSASSEYFCPDCSKPLAHRVKTAKDAPNGKGFDFWGCTGRQAGCNRTFRSSPGGLPIFS